MMGGREGGGGGGDAMMINVCDKRVMNRVQEGEEDHWERGYD